MRIISAIVFSVLCSSVAFGWGQTGHRAVGHIAMQHINKKTKKALEEILKHESLAIVSVWMDDIKSDDAWDHANDWHWVTIPNGMTYAEAEKNENGDIIMTIERLISELKTGNLTIEQKAIHIKMLTHLIGDIHQPLHVGNGTDRGGNQVSVQWFGSKTNIHSVWDSKIIDNKHLSYTELAMSIDHFEDMSTVEKWQNDDIMVWVQESRDLHKQVYDLPEDGRISYDYQYKNWDTIRLRIHQAGVRLAGVLNDIFS